jgi:hypothetical protein
VLGAASYMCVAAAGSQHNYMLTVALQPKCFTQNFTAGEPFQPSSTQFSLICDSVSEVLLMTEILCIFVVLPMCVVCPVQL